MADVWKIDAVSLDCSDVIPVDPVMIPKVSAALSGNDVLQKISFYDDDYSLLLPGDKLDLIFYDKDISAGSHYFLNVSGYLYEWYLKAPGKNIEYLSFETPGYSKLELFKIILKNKNLLLPPVYHEWEKVREIYH